MSTTEPLDPGRADRVRQYVARQGFLGLLGVTLTRLEPGVVEYRIAYRDALGQQDGVFHGGVVGGLAEAVMGAAAATVVAGDRNVVGAQYALNLLAPASGPALLARGTVVRVGRRLIVCRAEVFSLDDAAAPRLCAIAQGAMAAVGAPPPAPAC